MTVPSPDPGAEAIEIVRKLRSGQDRSTRLEAADLIDALLARLGQAEKERDAAGFHAAHQTEDEYFLKLRAAESRLRAADQLAEALTTIRNFALVQSTRRDIFDHVEQIADAALAAPEQNATLGEVKA